MSTPLKAAIFDMGDVLFTWNPIIDTRVTFEQLRIITHTRTWENFERGKISPTDCYEILGSRIGLSGSEIAATFRQTTSCLRPNEEMTSLLRELVAQGVKVYMMSNIPVPDYEQLRGMLYEWDLFDGIFASGLEGMRKPDAEFYVHLLRKVDLPAEQTVFVDDKIENVMAAQAVGMQGVHFVNAAETCRVLRCMVAESRAGICKDHTERTGRKEAALKP